MTEFTASNGVTIRVEVGGRVTITDHTRERLSAIAETIGRTAYVNKAQASALREFFQHERDEDRGVWRFSEEPDWVVREIDRDAFGRRRVQCLNERTFEKTEFNPVVATGESAKHRAAHAYFEAHPERKPWHDAKPGEVWVLTFDGADDTFKAYKSRYGTIYFTRSRETSTNLTNERITAGRRIWPEDAS